MHTVTPIVIAPLKAQHDKVALRFGEGAGDAVVEVVGSEGIK